MNNFSYGWYLLYVNTRQENKVAKHLSKLEIVYYLPQLRISRQWHDRKKILQVPLFPNYIFVYIENPKNYLDCQAINGVCGFVKSGKAPSKISQKVIDQLKIIVNNGENIIVSSDCFQPGQVLLIEQGPLKDISCEIVQYNGKDKIWVRVSFLNRSLLIDLPNYCLKTEAV